MNTQTALDPVALRVSGGRHRHVVVDAVRRHHHAGLQLVSPRARRGELVEELAYRPGWTFTPRGPRSRSRVEGADARNRRSWQRWLLEQLFLVEQHEACEFFTLAGEHPYAPHHGPGNDPYTVFESGTDEDARTSFRGDVKP